MKEIFRIVALSLYLAFLCCACSKKDKSEAASGTQVRDSKTRKRQAFPGESDLNRLITPGVPLDRVVELFGKPSSRRSLDDGSIWILYLNSDEDQPSNSLTLSGFTVLARENKVINWQPVFSRTTGLRQNAEQPLDYTIKQDYGGFELRVVIMKDEQNVLQSAWDNQPHVVITNLVRAEAIGQGRSDRQKQTLLVELTERDAKRLTDLTRDKAGSRAAFVVGTNLLMSAVILDPLETREIAIEVESSRTGEIVNVLQRFVERSQRK